MLLSLRCTFSHRMCVRSGVRRALGVYLCSFLVRIRGKRRVLLDILTVSEVMARIIVKPLSITASQNCQEEFLGIYEERQQGRKVLGNNKPSS